jgi:hypothetical protein
MPRSMKRAAAVELLAKLGWDDKSPIARSVLVTALDALSDGSKLELCRFLAPVANLEELFARVRLEGALPCEVCRGPAVCANCGRTC